MEVPSGANIKQVRISLELTQNELAERCGLSQSVIARIENEVVDPRSSTLKKIVEALNRAADPSGTHTVEDVMVRDIYCLSPEDSVSRVVKIMIEQGISQLPVLKDGVIQGIISEAVLLKEGVESETLVSTLMRHNPLIVRPNTTISEVRSRLTSEEVVLVVNEGELIGLVSRIDIIKAQQD